MSSFIYSIPVALTLWWFRHLRKTTPNPLRGKHTASNFVNRLNMGGSRGGGRMPRKSQKEKKFDGEILDDYLDARDSCRQICSVYEQVCAARCHAEEDQEASVQALEAELIEDYLEKVQNLANRLKSLEGRIPFECLTDLIRKLPERVAKDVLELQPA